MKNKINLSLVFKCLSDSIRIDILRKLYISSSVCVCELTDCFNLTQSKLSYHLKLLVDANLLTKTSQGKWNFYSVNKNILEQVLTEESINELFFNTTNKKCV